MDFRDLNGATLKDEYPMLVLEVLVNATVGHKVFSFKDRNVGYNQFFMPQKSCTRLHSWYPTRLDCSSM